MTPTPPAVQTILKRVPGYTERKPFDLADPFCAKVALYSKAMHKVLPFDEAECECSCGHQHVAEDHEYQCPHCGEGDEDWPGYDFVHRSPAVYSCWECGGFSTSPDEWHEWVRLLKKLKAQYNISVNIPK